MNWKDAPVTKKCTSWAGGALFALITIFALLTTVFLGTKNAIAATNSTINFQARLMTAGGAIVPDGFYNVEFKLYSAVSSSGSSQGSCTGDAACLWTETRTGVDTVRVANGYLTANLGSITAFPGTINWNQELWLSMNIGGTSGSPSWDGPMTPRLKLTAVPYAFRAGQLANTNGSFTSTVDFVQPTANRNILLPDESGTICIQNSINCGFLTGSTSDFIQNQNTIDQPANFRINGTGRAAVSLQAPLFDTATATALGIGTTNATAINLNKSTVVTGGLTQSGGTVSLTGNGTSSFTTSTGTIDIRAGGTSTLTLNTGGAGTVNLGTDSTTTINIGGGTDVARTIRVGSPTTGTAAQAVIMGSQNTTSTTVIQGGTGPSAIAVTPALNGSIELITTGTGTIGLRTANKAIIQSTTNSLQAMQIQNAAGTQIFGVDTTNARIGINVDFPEVSLDVSGAIQQTGLLTSDSGGSFSNQWTKLGSCQINDQFAQCFTILNITGGNDGSDNNNTQATVSARVKQQDPLGSAPIVDLTLNGVARVITAADIKTVTTQNDGTATVVELWGRITIGFEHWQYTPTINTGGSFWAPWHWTPVSGFQAALPAGTQTAATYGTTYADTLTVQASGVGTVLQVQNASSVNLFTVASDGTTTIGTGSSDITLQGNTFATGQTVASQGFEGVTFVPTSPGTWSTGGNTSWARTTAQFQEGTASAASGTIGNNQTSWLDLNYTMATAGNLTFYWKVSSEQDFDYLLLCVDNDACTLSGGFYKRISGTVDWTQVSIPLTAGAHSIRWVYAKDNADAGGSDKGWIDNIMVKSGGGLQSDGTLQAGGNIVTLNRVGIGTLTPTRSLEVLGDAFFQNAADSTNAFQVRNASGIELFDIDSLNSEITFGDGTGVKHVLINLSTNDGILQIGATGGNLQMQIAQRSNGPSEIVTPGDFNIRATSTSTTALQIQNSSSVSLLTVDTSSTQRVRIGPSGGDSTGTLLLLGIKTGSSTDPGTPVNGAMYYNATSSRFRCYEASTWKDCVYGFNTITKASDQPAAPSSTAFQNDNTLSFSVATSSNYEIDAWIPIDNSNATATGKYTFTVPAGATLNLATANYSSATANTVCNITTSGQTCVLSASSAANFIQVRGFIRTGGTGGTVQFQFAQNVSTAASFPVVKKGATLSWHN